MPKAKVLLGMSGGVDSSVAAALLLEQGYEVIGAFMRNWSDGILSVPVGTGLKPVSETCATEGPSECGWREERRDAMRVASQLGIPFLTFDFEREYRDLVVEYLFREYQAGRTPNPDVMCNKFVKFDLFLREADKLGCDFIATGHYARIEKASANCRLLKAIDPNKDQTYFLWAIPPAVLPRVLFPVGHLPKPEVRCLAEERGLVTARKPDSTGICFVGEIDVKAFLKTRIQERPGDIVTTEGTVVGAHDGMMFYTIGQRHGLNVGGGRPYYVVGKNTETNVLIVSDKESPALFRQDLTAVQANWFRIPTTYNLQPTTFRCTARIRHRQPVAPCTVSFAPGQLPDASCQMPTPLRIHFDEPQRAVTPGQSIVFYDGDEMLGGAIIE